MKRSQAVENDRLNNSSGPDSENVVISRPMGDTSARNSSNKVATSPSVLSTRQEIFGKEICKVQELMVEQEQSCERELEELTSILTKLEEENSALENRIAELESKESDQSEKALEIAEKEDNYLSTKLANLSKKQKEILVVVDEYQRSSARFQSQYDADEQNLLEQKKKLAEEIDIALQHVNSMEAQFNSIHLKYEKCKNVIEQRKNCEKKLVQLSQDSSEKIRLTSRLFQSLKDNATEKLEKCNNDMTSITKFNRTEQAKLQAILQRMDLRYEGQEHIILLKNNEIKETVNMCDGLIGKFHE